MNSWVPKEFGSITPPQLGLSVTVRGLPIPLRQWYSSAKQPPGQRTFGTRIAFSACNDIVANAASIWNCRIRPDPDAVINAVSKVFGELAENIAVDFCARLG